MLHGVELADDGSERLSWIIWYRDSSTCEEHGHRWHRKCAEAGDAVCQYLHAHRAHLAPGLNERVATTRKLKWLRRAAKQGLGRAMTDLALNLELR